MEHLTENQKYIAILREELVPAMGCTEPISLAYAAAVARCTLGALPESAVVTVSGNIIKNVKSVIVPHTGGLRGIAAAVAAGFVAGDETRHLEVLSRVPREKVAEIAAYLQKNVITVEQSDSGRLFEIIITAQGNGHTVRVEITDGHTKVSRIEMDGKELFAQEEAFAEAEQTDRSFMTVEGIVRFAEETELEEVIPVLSRQIACNTAIAMEGLTGKYGAAVGKVLLDTYGDNVHTRAKAWAAAGSDARMSGCELPVVINSGSGNQGLTASLPVIVYAKELKVSQEKLYRALLVSNLVTIHLKTGIGCLSAYCGAISAGCGAGAGVTYLFGGDFKAIAHTVVNAIAINSGVVCDGAKASCAAKIASSVEAGLLGMYMYQNGRQFFGGDGIVTKGVERTIENVSALAREGMKETDKEILKIMLSC